ncbi:MAG: 1-deoxy-D-xylulose-5-phosphate synthase [Actinobacteria bacterium]|nr:1-deoxy-D-xylulose-5-phosphate synthase [Actinomycetota bacterium]MBV9254394.1 1-deoxy-D-xylulose-5-phosphate synthase [Actinomycetota bacterium]MBV9663380.1 1-deoxy-D-xylulose-5-phosphate synthase [Actinomycetota bacterium]MBV9936332.1 1-deoxy-D-xylulose-5-phosphate synthase [Actinomycetota bacterium]
MWLERVNSPADLKALGQDELRQLATEIRDFIVNTVSVTGGHLGSNLGAVELTLALHRVFDSPRDVILWDTGHQAYVHKLVTGRRSLFSSLRQAGGLSGYPNRKESEHDWIENSHASTVLSYAHGVATAFDRNGERGRKVVAVVGDGAMTGGMAFEGLNNLGHSGRRVVIVLNDNGRSYAPTISRLSEGVSRLRLNPSYVAARARLEQRLRGVPGLGEYAYSSLQGVKAAIRELLEPMAFFENLGVRYTGPIDGHDIPGIEQALRHAADYDGPIVVHVLTKKGKGYKPAEEDEEQNLHDLKVVSTSAQTSSPPPAQWTVSFTEALLAAAEKDPKLVAITAAMPGPTGLLPLQKKYPERFLDVGIAEQHAITAAAGMAMGGLHPVVAVYSTFFSRAFDQANLDVGLHKQHVVFALDRAGITGDDGPSHHGVLDMALCLRIPGMTIFAPSSAQDLKVMFAEALDLEGPVAIRWPKGPARQVGLDEIGTGLNARKVRAGTDACILAVGKMVEACEEAADILEGDGISCCVWDVRVVNPLDPAMLMDAATFPLVVTAEDGVRVGGAGSHITDALAGLDEGRHAPPVLMLGTPAAFIPQGKPAQIHIDLGLDGPGIAASVAKALAAGRLPIED